jgi:hypothetical protein
MKKNNLLLVRFILLFVIICCKTISTTAQIQSKPQSLFWNKVQFGGGLQLNIGSGFTNIGVSPSMLYNVNEFVSVGSGLQVSYVSANNNYSSLIYGINLTTLFNPIETIQLSVDLEQLRVSTTFENSVVPKQNFWNTGLWLGAGFRTNNITVGGRYNVLYNKNNSVYSDAFLPFVRVYF